MVEPNESESLPTKVSSVVRFKVQSSDVISDMRINVSEVDSDTVIWYKERFLSDDEIIEHVVHNTTSTLCWTIHRPVRGWYIRIRSPAFAPGMYIPFMPVPRVSPQYVDAALSFNARTHTTSPRESDTTSQGRLSLSSAHSYPPTPPIFIAQPPSPKTAETVDEESSQSQSHKVGETTITQFLLTPHSTQVAHPTSYSIFARALSILKNNRPTQSNSFTLFRLPPSSSLLPPPPPYASTLSTLALAEASRPSGPVATQIPVLVFLDRTPIYTVRSITGLIEVDRAEEKFLGVDTSFWIAVALTYLEFLEERESYLAAVND